MQPFDLIEPGARRFRVRIKRGATANFRHARAVRRDHRTTEGHGFESRQSETLCQRGKGKTKCVSIKSRKIVVGDKTEHANIWRGGLFYRRKMPIGGPCHQKIEAHGIKFPSDVKQDLDVFVPRAAT